jgi:hypothetical protein
MHSQVKTVLIEVPTHLINKYVKDFKDLAGSKHRESVYILRDSIDEIMFIIDDNPELLEEPEYKDDYIKAIAMKEALIQHGIYYDA